MDYNFTSEIIDAVTSRGSNHGGLFNFTSDYGYRKANLENAYNFGDVGRYGWAGSNDGDIEGTGSLFYYSHITNGLETPVLERWNRGMGYTVSTGTQSNLKFVTKEEFTTFESLLRGRNLTYSRGENAYQSQYGDNEKFTASGVTKTSRGTQYVEGYRKRYALKEPLSGYSKDFRQKVLEKTDIINKKIKRTNEANTYSEIKASNNSLIENAAPNPKYHNGDLDVNDYYVNIDVEDTETSNTKTRDESGKIARDWLSRYNHENPVIKNQGVTSEGFSSLYEYGDEYDVPDRINSINSPIGSGGLREYSKDLREKLYNHNPFTYKSAYGISSEREENEYGDDTYSGNIIVDESFKGGTHYTVNEQRQGTYIHFEGESDANGTGEFNADSVSDNTAVSLSDFKNTSGILRATNELFANAKIGTLINRFHTSSGLTASETLSAFDSQFGLSRGRNLLVKDAKKGSRKSDTGYDNPYCRAWTAHHQYARLRDRIRPFYNEEGEPVSISDVQSLLPETMRPYDGVKRLANNTVLQNDGFVKITPNRGDRTKDDIKKCMFSIENLAWKDIIIDEELSGEQRGPNGGRVMWFPPYNLKFSENVSVNWNSNNFIGRGEEIYTYTNTNRSGTLDFTILIDHPSILNTWRGTGEQVSDIKEAQDDLLRYFAGCSTLNEPLTEGGTLEETSQQEDIDNRETNPSYSSKDIAYVVFFPNEFSGNDYIKDDNIDGVIKELEQYECDASGSIYMNRDSDLADDDIKPWNSANTNTYNLNSGTSQDKLIKEILLGSNDEKITLCHFSDLLKIGEQFSGDTIFGMPAGNCKLEKIEIGGFSVKNHGTESKRKKLCKRRAKTLKKILMASTSQLKGKNFQSISKDMVEVPDIDDRKDINTLNAKIARAALVIFHVQWKDSTEAVNLSTVTNYNQSEENKASASTAETVTEKSNVVVVENTNYTYDNEYQYFSSIRGDKMVYNNIINKVKYFDPAFHSITPEGFNARLTFLHQCTRQGPTVTANGAGKSGNNYLNYAGNLGFGRAPYCILRIGDFYYTKICIDSLSISYDAGGGIQWDINPEGVGVQPMFANITIGFKFLGGQDITGPIERLQNAVTANYYANASIYDRHADNDESYYDAVGQTMTVDDDKGENGPVATLHRIYKQ